MITLRPPRVLADIDLADLEQSLFAPFRQYGVSGEACDVHASLIGARGEGLFRLIGQLVSALLILSGASPRPASVRARPNSPYAVIVTPYREEVVVVRAGHAAADLINLALQGLSGEAIAKRVQVFQKSLGNELSRLPILDELDKRGAPYRELDGPHALVELGWGRLRRRFHLGVTDRTSRIANMIATDKLLAGRIMRQHGVPTPRQAAPTSLADALAIARKSGYPVVVKPRGTDKGVAVFADVRDEEALIEAYREASAHGGVILESRLPGEHHRLFILNGELVSTSQLLSARVTGDGVHTVAQLIALQDAERRANPSTLKPHPVILGSETPRLIASQGHTEQTVPGLGEIVRLRSASNVALGGTWRDHSHNVHPVNRDAAIRAATAVGLDSAGVDFICPDIALPYTETGGGVCEINPRPGLHGYHLTPDSPDVVRQYVEALLPPGSDGRIPLVAVHGDASGALAARLATGLADRGQVVGLASIAGVEIGGRRIVADPSDTRDGAWMVLADPQVEAAVIAVGAPSLLEDGLGFDRPSVLVLDGLDPRAPPEAAQAIAGLLLSLAGRIAANIDVPEARALVDPDGEIVWYSPSGAADLPKSALEAMLLCLEPAGQPAP